MISILITSRVEGNINHRLPSLLASLTQHTVKPSELEVLIKFDDDDNAGQDANDFVERMLYPFKVKTCFGPRGRGYIDIHHGYNQLLADLLNPNARVIGAMADDFTVNPGWDVSVLDAVEGAGEYFIVHQRPHPRSVWVDKVGILSDSEYPFCLSDDAFDAANLHVIDEAPLWSKKLLKTLTPDGHVQPMPLEPFPVSFTDAWTICLEHELWWNHRVDLTKFMPGGIVINRTTCEVDQPGDKRWDTDRKTNFDYINSHTFRRIVREQARSIACRL